MEATTYSFRSCIRGYHVYKDIWDSVVGEVLDCEHEPDNPHDTHAVAVKRVQGQGGMQQIVGWPLTLSRVFHLFLKHGGQISVEVTGKRRNKGIGLEIPATYLFYHKKPSKVKKLIELIRDKEESRS